MDIARLLIPFLMFGGSLVALLVAAHYFTAAAERVGLALGMSPFVVGVFIVAIGTSLPELVDSLVSVRMGASEIVSGNVLGANTANFPADSWGLQHRGAERAH